MSPNTTASVGPRNRHDQPVRMERFVRSIRIRKVLLGLLIPVILGTRISLIILDKRSRWWPDSTAINTLAWGYVNLGFTISLALLYLVHLLPWSNDHPLYSRHANITTAMFFSTIFSCVTYVVPSLVYILKTRHRLPPYPTNWNNDFTISALWATEIVAVLLAFGAIGTMRRGPELYFEAHRLTIGYGWAMEDKKQDEEPVALKPSRLSRLVNARRRRMKQPAKPSPEESETTPLLNSSVTSPTAYSPTSDRSAEEEESEPEPNVLDYYQGSIFSLLFIGYIWPLARITASRPELRPDDLPQMPEILRSENVMLPRLQERFVLTTEELAIKEKQDSMDDDGMNVTHSKKDWTPWSLLMAVCAGQGWLIFTSVWFEWIYNASTFLPQFCMHQIIETFEDPNRKEDMTYAYLMVFGLFFGNFAGNLLSSFSRIRENLVNHKAIRVNLRTMLFHKILTITDDQSPDATGSGRAQILNLMNVDVVVIASLATRVLGLTNAGLMLVLSGGFLYSMFSWSALIAIATIPLMTPFTAYVARITYRCDKDLAKARDARIGAMREVLMAVKVVKLNAWEEHHRRRIEIFRKREVRLQRWRFTIGTAFNILAEITPLIAIFVMFVSYTKLQGRVLHASSAFVATIVFNQVQASLGQIPEIVQKALLALVSLRRLCGFLNSEVVEHCTKQRGALISLEHASVTWPSRKLEADEVATRELFRLQDMNLRFPDDARFVLVSGPTGSGKTLFLLSLLGEAKLLEGSIIAPKSRYGAIPLPDEISQAQEHLPDDWIQAECVAYAAQIPYITHGTLRESIVFGLPYIPSRYEAVVEQCGLNPDFAMFEHGDQQEIGVSGVTLSGGQRARISLARAVYSRAGTILVDDLLSSLDATTSQYIYAHCLKGDTLKGRRIVMVSHNVSLLLPTADLVIQLKNGGIAKAGSAKELREDLLLEEEREVNEEFHSLAPPVAEKTKSISTSTVSARRIYQEEHQESGNVHSSHYRFVVENVGGVWYWAGLLTFVVSAQITFLLTRFVIQFWTADPTHNNFWIAVWASIATIRILLTSMRWFWLYGNEKGGFTMRAAARMHNAMVDRILRAPLRFYDRTPEGRILNRFSNDIQRVDGELPDGIGRTIMESLEVVSNVLVLSFTLPPVIIAVALLAYPFNILRVFFGRLRASLGRLNAILASPISGLTYEAIGSIVTVRGFGSSRFLCQIFAAFEDVSNRMSMCSWAVWIAFSSLMLTITSLLLGTTGFFLLGSNLSASTAGFTLAFAVDLSMQVFWLLDRVVNLEEQMVSVERMNEIAQIPPEDEGEEHLSVPETWPRTGGLVVNSLSVRYAADLPMVLQGISFTAKPGERVCVVGRTGGGKSTLALSLLRDLSPASGSIKIDGEDISRIPLHILRTKLSYIPQESLLTSGSLREALDITGEKDDHELYAAMKQVHLDIAPGSPFSSLDTQVSTGMFKLPILHPVLRLIRSLDAIAGGLNFSLGERQLLVLARAMLKSSKLVIMDEATSSVDYETDAKITAALKEMKGTTIITIAHRLRTIIDYDRVLVLKHGAIIENDSPAVLIRREGSEFRKLCLADGPIEYQQLLASAGRGRT